MTLRNLLQGIDYELIQGNIDLNIEDISYDSRTITDKMAFIALKGIDTDGHKYIPQVIEKGCRSLIVSEDIEIDNSLVTIIKLEDTRSKLAILSANLFCHPATELITIGITGTKGKTTNAYMLKSVLESAGYKVGVIGTVGTIIDNKLYEHKNTTPESYYIQKYLRKMVDVGTQYVIMEVSSQALKVGRVSNIIFDYAIFTNLSIDHIGAREHPTFEDYIYSKSLLFKQSKIGIINKDDEHYEDMIKDSTSKNYYFGKSGDLILDNVDYYKTDELLGIKIKTSNLINDEFLIPAPGLFSAYNALSVIVLAKIIGINTETIKNGLKYFVVPGRCEIYNIPNNIKVIIDYAHNKVSMESIIKTMKEYKDGRVITVFGCGGGRSFERRFELGEMSGKFADLSIVTMDNPRNDNIKEINADIVKGIVSVNGSYEVIEDREEAIRYAITNAKKNDIILLLGKGHEKFQQIGDKIIPFYEEKIIASYIN